ncbi:MAG: NAD(+) synthase [Firmicutes bacterium]|nr:NAD(+) synthase [Bacillota bacterium]
MYSLIRTGAAVPLTKVADCSYNKEEILKLINLAEEKGISVLAFPELCLCASTCGDLLFQSRLIKSCEETLAEILAETKNKDMIIILGLPVAADNQIFNCAAVIHKGTILGITAKTYITESGKRYFASSDNITSDEITLCGQTVPWGGNMLYTAENFSNLCIGVELGEDIFAPIPPSSYMAMAGATVILNLSAENELAGRKEYRKKILSAHSASNICSYVYASAGLGESTQDAAFSGHSMIYENGILFKETKPFSKEGQIIYSDIDIEQLSNDRRKNSTFMSHNSVFGLPAYRISSFNIEVKNTGTLERYISAKPFIPEDKLVLKERCADIFSIQVSGLAKRMMHTNSKSLVIGISGGLDSTLSLLAAAKACDYLGMDRKTILGVTMPGFGTTDRTYNNAINLMKSLGISLKEVSIKDSVTLHFKEIDHDMNVHDVTYENAQARERTQILMDLANKHLGMVVGTGDLSELALGWATYNGDHMSNYGTNAAIPKTLVRELVKYVAESGELDKSSAAILFDVLDTPVSPELLPPDESGNIKQKTEDLVGPYELHDFFLHYVIRHGFAPAKIMYYAENAFEGVYDRETILKWLKNFYRRFFSQQFKRSCLPDGPKVGTISLSPRGDWKMPSDAVNKIWMDEVEKL